MCIHWYQLHISVPIEGKSLKTETTYTTKPKRMFCCCLVWVGKLLFHWMKPCPIDLRQCKVYKWWFDINWGISNVVPISVSKHVENAYICLHVYSKIQRCNCLVNFQGLCIILCKYQFGGNYHVLWHDVVSVFWQLSNIIDYTMIS